MFPNAILQSLWSAIKSRNQWASSVSKIKTNYMKKISEILSTISSSDFII